MSGVVRITNILWMTQCSPVSSLGYETHDLGYDLQGCMVGKGFKIVMADGLHTMRWL